MEGLRERIYAIITSEDGNDLGNLVALCDEMELEEAELGPTRDPVMCTIHLMGLYLANDR